MADQVLYIMDKMATLFKSMEHLKVFTSSEVKDIVKKRTQYEYVLKRRVLTTSDYYSYIQYEITLEKLCSIRCLKLSDGSHNNDKKGKSDDTVKKKEKDALRSLQASFIRHICYVFDRAIRRFPQEVSLWIDYIAFLKEKDATALLNAAFGRVLALHPKNEQFWLQAAVHELEHNGNAHAARILLQRSLRSNKHSTKLWIHYFEFELWSAMRILERQRILGLEVDHSIILNGAPGVVLRHALKAIKDIDYACDLHRVCSASSKDLSKQLVVDLLDIYKDDSRLYEYLCDYITDDLLRIEIDDDGNIGKKRKRKLVSAIDTLEKCQLALESCSELLNSAKLSLNESSYLWTAVRCIEKISLKINTSIGFISEQCLLIPSKNARTLNATDSISAAVTKFYKALNLIYAFLPNVSEKMVDLESLPILCYEAISCHRLWMLNECIPTPTSITMPKTQSISSLITMISSISSKLSTLHKSPVQISAKSLKAKNISADNDSLSLVQKSKMERSVDAWAALINVLLESILRVNMSDENNIDLVAAAKAAINGATVGVCFKSGDNLIKKCLEILSIGHKDIVISTIQKIITDLNIDSFQRGHWCVKYIRYQIHENGNEVKVSLKSTFDWIQQNIISSLPHLTVSTSMVPFYDLVLRVSMQLFRESVKDNSKSAHSFELYTFAKNIAEVAVKTCPSDKNFWILYEEIERTMGNHQTANNILHRHKMNK